MLKNVETPNDVDDGFSFVLENNDFGNDLYGSLVIGFLDIVIPGSVPSSWSLYLTNLMTWANHGT